MKASGSSGSVAMACCPPVVAGRRRTSSRTPAASGAEITDFCFVIAALSLGVLLHILNEVLDSRQKWALVRGLDIVYSSDLLIT
jgi:hypothetical protein